MYIKNLDRTSFPNRAVKIFSVATHLFSGIILKIRKTLRWGTPKSMKLSKWDYVYSFVEGAVLCQIPSRHVFVRFFLKLCCLSSRTPKQDHFWPKSNKNMPAWYQRKNAFKKLQRWPRWHNKNKWHSNLLNNKFNLILVVVLELY